MRSGQIIVSAFTAAILGLMLLALWGLEWTEIADDPCENCGDDCGGSCMGARQ